MNPFFVLGLPIDPSPSDAEVEARYHALLRRHSPDAAPERFRLLHAAYEALRTAPDRLRAELFDFDVRGQSLASDLPTWLDGQPRRRLSEAELAAFLRGKDGA